MAKEIQPRRKISVSRMAELTRLTLMLTDQREKKESPPEQKKGFFFRNSQTIQAWCAVASVVITSMLAYLTHSSLEEVRKQRELSFKQFVIENLPSITIFAGIKPEISDDKFFNLWQAQNLGGPVRNIVYHAILLAFDGQGKSDSTLVIRNGKRPSFGKPEILSIKFYTNSKESIAWIKGIMQSNNKILILATKISYEIPEELSLNNKPKADSRENVFVWDKPSDRFEDTTAITHELVLDYINQKQLWDLDDRG